MKNIFNTIVLAFLASLCLSQISLVSPDDYFNRIDQRMYIPTSDYPMPKDMVKDDSLDVTNLSEIMNQITSIHRDPHKPRDPVAKTELVHYTKEGLYWDTYLNEMFYYSDKSRTSMYVGYVRPELKGDGLIMYYLYETVSSKLNKSHKITDIWIVEIIFQEHYTFCLMSGQEPVGLFEYRGQNIFRLMTFEEIEKQDVGKKF